MDEEYRLWYSLFPKYYHLLKPFPDAKKVLEWMRGNNVKVIILSSHQQDLVNDEIEKYGFKGLIDAVDAGKQDKREKIEEFIAKHGIEKEKAIYVGDMCHDIETARLAGVKSVAVLGGYDSREKLERENPDYIIEGVGELPALIEKISGGEHARATANG